MTTRSTNQFLITIVLLLAACADDFTGLQAKIDAIETRFNASHQAILYNPARAATPSAFLGQTFVVRRSQDGSCADLHDLEGAANVGNVLDLSTANQENPFSELSAPEVVSSLIFNSEAQADLVFGSILGGLGISAAQESAVELIVRRTSQSVIETAEFNDAVETKTAPFAEENNVCFVYVAVAFQHLTLDKRIFVKSKEDAKARAGKVFSELSGDLFVSTEEITKEDVILLDLLVSYQSPFASAATVGEAVPFVSDALQRAESK
jgi:hypothetical protein